MCQLAVRQAVGKLLADVSCCTCWPVGGLLGSACWGHVAVGAVGVRSCNPTTGLSSFSLLELA